MNRYVEETRWPQAGGHPVLDLANTVSWRLDPLRQQDLLATVDQVRDWADAHLTGLPRGAAPVTGKTLSAVVELRYHLIAVLDAHADQATLPAESSHALFTAAADYIGSSAAPTALPLEPEPAQLTDSSLSGYLALAAMDLLRGSRLERVRRCAGADCGWFFLDQTKNSSRRWCQANGCGNLVRTRRYTARRQAQRTGSKPNGAR